MAQINMEQILAKAEQIVKKLMADKDLMEKFEKNPAAVIEEYIGFDLPDEQVIQAVEAIKARIKLEQAGNLLGSIGSLFGKK